MSKKVGFIGNGNMARAMMAGLIASGLYGKDSILVSARTEESLRASREDYGVRTSLDNRELARESDILILAVKPNLYDEIIGEIRDEVTKDTILISIAAGRSIEDMERSFARELKLVRSMPNTPVLVGEGMSALTFSDSLEEEERQLVIDIFESFGRVEIVDESLMDAVTAVSGSSPAYIYLLIEAMADGGVRESMPRDMAYRMAAQAVLGAAKMVLETGEHPGTLKDRVTSPGGTTIEAVAKLEEEGFRQAVLKGMEACANKSREMSKSIL